MLRYAMCSVLAAQMLLVRPAAAAAGLPGLYYRLLEAGMAKVEQRLNAGPPADLRALEARGNGWRLFPHNVLAAAVLYARQDPANRRYRDPKMLALAMRIGDLLATESDRGTFESRLNSDRDAYMWLDAFRLLRPQLGAERRQRWQRALFRSIEIMAEDSARIADFPGYQSPFIGTSPNHLSLWASTVYLAGRVFAKPEWEKLGDFFSSPGILTEVIHVFLARGLEPSGLEPEEHEVFETSWIPLDEAVEMAAHGRIRDAKSLIGLLWARERLGAR